MQQKGSTILDTTRRRYLIGRLNPFLVEKEVIPSFQLVTLKLGVVDVSGSTRRDDVFVDSVTALDMLVSLRFSEAVAVNPKADSWAVNPSIFIFVLASFPSSQLVEKVLDFCVCSNSVAAADVVRQE
jgi:hypothetical protein